MPPKFKFSKDEMIKNALEITRESGISALTARALDAKLGCSVKPIFGLFQNMEELHQEVMHAAQQRYQNYLQEDMSKDQYPPYKASGMAYIRFAKEEPALFKLLFMRDRSDERVTEQGEEIRPLIELIQKNTGLNEEEAYLFHLEMWVYVHGIATMIATGYLQWDTEFVSKVLTDAYIGLKYRYCGKEKEDGSN